MSVVVVNATRDEIIHARDNAINDEAQLKPVVKVVMCSRGGGAEPLRSRRTKISIQCCKQKLHFKLSKIRSISKLIFSVSIQK